jgi:hypothetical protein
MTVNESRRQEEIDKQALRTIFILVASIVVTLLLFYVVPYGRRIAYPLILLSTLIHELGHGLASLLCGYEFYEFHMYADGSGVAMTEGGKGPFARAFVSAGGLVGPALVAALFFAMGGDERKARRTLTFFATALLLAVVLVVRNPFGVVFVSITAGLCFLVANWGKPWHSHVLLLFIACQLALTVFSRGDYLFSEHAVTSEGLMPSDVQKMADALLLPYWFWGGLCGLISIFVLYAGLKASFRKL